MNKLKTLKAINTSDLTVIARAILDTFKDERVFALNGKMGAGKTTLVKAFAKVLGSPDVTSSPTFSLINEYGDKQGSNFYHFDFYRFRDPKEWRDAGFSEYFNDSSVCLVEWPEKAAGLLPPADLDIAIEFAGDGRELSIRAGTESGKACLDRLTQLPP